MIRKIMVFIESDGLLNTLRFIVNAIIGGLGDKSITLCLVGKKADLKVQNRNCWSRFSSRTYTTTEELDSVNFPRLKYTPYTRWLKAGAVCRVVFEADIPVAFSWTHYEKHSINKIGTFDMENDIAWLGPYIVHKKYRGLSLQQFLIGQDVLECGKDINCFITSVNQENASSLHSFLKLGFHIGGNCTNSHGKTKVDIEDEFSSYLKISR